MHMLNTIDYAKSYEKDTLTIIIGANISLRSAALQVTPPARIVLRGVPQLNLDAVLLLAIVWLVGAPVLVAPG